MAKTEGGKRRLLLLKDILEQRTDETHPLTTAQLIAALEEQGVTVERKALYDDLHILEEYGMDIVRAPGHGGYYLGARAFSLPELKLLIDAVGSSKFLTQKKTRELIAKLSSLGGLYAGQLLRREVLVYGRPKSMNESVFYNTDLLHDAIARNSSVTFRYFGWDLPHEKRYRPGLYEASPLALLWDNDNYYLVAYGARHGITHYRVDKMDSVSLTGTPRVVNAQTRAFDPGVYSRQVFGMYNGEVRTVKLRFARALAGVVYDRFGHDAMLIPDGAQHFTYTAPITVSALFFSWLSQFGAEVELCAPADVRAQYAAHCRSILALYE